MDVTSCIRLVSQQITTKSDLNTIVLGYNNKTYRFLGHSFKHVNAVKQATM